MDSPLSILSVLDLVLDLPLLLRVNHFVPVVPVSESFLRQAGSTSNENGIVGSRSSVGRKKQKKGRSIS